MEEWVPVFSPPSYYQPSNGLLVLFVRFKPSGGESVPRVRTRSLFVPNEKAKQYAAEYMFGKSVFTEEQYEYLLAMMDAMGMDESMRKEVRAKFVMDIIEEHFKRVI
jgi:hypothetical protein